MALIAFGVIALATGIGVLVGYRVRHLSEHIGEPVGVLQAAMLGVVGLILAFGLSLAVSRYQDRRVTLVVEANAIGTTYLRAQTLPEPIRSRSLRLLERYTRSAVELAENRPRSDAEERAAASERAIQRRLWALGAAALDRAPRASAPRLYIETLNEMIDSQTARTAALANTVPGAVFIFSVLAAALALGLLAAHMTIVGRGIAAVWLGSALVAFLLALTADLDRPTEGLIQVPDRVLVDLLDSMQLQPAARPPTPR